MNESRFHRLFPITIVFATAIAFLPVLANDFVDFDDPVNFVHNEDFRGLGMDQIRWMWTSHLSGHYIPITWMTLGLDYSLWGMAPLGYHLTNIVWHAANALVFYFLALALFSRAIPESDAVQRARIPLGALFAALLFAVHPLRAESVAWVTERRDVVSGLFYLLAILIYVRGVQDAPGRPIKRTHFWGCFALFVLGILSKEMIVTLPAVLLILDFYPLRRLAGGPARWFGPESRGVWIEKIPFFVISFADSALSMQIVHQEKMAASLAVLNWFTRIAISIYGLAFYLWKSIFPLYLSPFYALTQHRVDPGAMPFLISLCAVLLLMAAAIGLRRRIPALLAVVLAYAITLIPVLGIFHNGSQITADRYSYLACLGWAMLAGGALIWLRGPGSQAALACAVLVICALGFLTWRQVQVWRDAESLWTQAVKVDPSFLAYDNLGLALSARGDTVGAIELYRNSIQLSPDFADAHNNLGASLMNLGEWGDAEREYQRAVTLNPDLARAHGGLGYVLLKQGKLTEAISHFRIALQIDPSLTPVRAYLDQAVKDSGTSQ
jgi:protein O-mannosyl-transferase